MAHADADTPTHPWPDPSIPCPHTALSLSTLFLPFPCPLHYTAQKLPTLASLAPCFCAGRNALAFQLMFLGAHCCNMVCRLNWPRVSIELCPRYISICVCAWLEGCPYLMLTLVNACMSILWSHATHSLTFHVLQELLFELLKTDCQRIVFCKHIFNQDKTHIGF